jgi:hypothetical protein
MAVVSTRPAEVGQHLEQAGEQGGHQKQGAAGEAVDAIGTGDMVGGRRLGKTLNSSHCGR